MKSSTGYNIVRIINYTPNATTYKVPIHSLYGFTIYGNANVE